MRGSFKWAILMSLGVASPLYADVTLISSNFDSATSGTYTANTTIDGLTANIPTVTASDPTLPNGFGMIVTNADSNGNKSVQMADNSTASNANFYLGKTITASTVSTDGTGNDLITGSFSVTRLAIPAGSGTEGSFRFLLDKAGETNGTSGYFAYLRFNGNGFQYVNGTSGILNLPTTGTGAHFSTSIGTTYVFTVSVDLSSTSQDTWSFTINGSDGSSFSSLASLGTLQTGIANGTPGLILFSDGVNSGAASANPNVQLDDVTFTASPVPEPGTATIAGSMMSGLFILRRRQRATPEQ